MTNAGRSVDAAGGSAVPGEVNRVFETQQTGSVAQVEVGSRRGGSLDESQAVPRPKGLARLLPGAGECGKAVAGRSRGRLVTDQYVVVAA